MLANTESMDPRNLSDTELLTRTDDTAGKEKAMTIELLKHLHEVERRRLYAARAFSSLWEYVHRGLGYSEAQASERVNAMRLMFSVPEAREKVETGELSLAAASRLQRFFKTEKKHFGKCYTPDQKLELVSECSGQSKRDVEKILLARAPGHVTLQESQKQITPEYIELRFAISEVTRQKLEQVQNLKGTLPLGELFDQALEHYLRALQKGTRREKAVKPASEDVPPVMHGTRPATSSPAEAGQGVQMHPHEKPGVTAEQSRNKDVDTDSERRAIIGFPQSRHIPARTRVATRERAEGRCEFRDPETGRRCESRFRLQFEHRKPYASGGLSTSDNVLHYCPAHNQLEAIRRFGVAKMSEYIPGLSKT